MSREWSARATGEEFFLCLIGLQVGAVLGRSYEGSDQANFTQELGGSSQSSFCKSHLPYLKE